jgi:hypothetical protein
MKKLFLTLLVSFSLFSCSDNQDIAREKIEEQISKYAHDAKSYEFIEMGKPDTIKKSDLLFSEIKILSIDYEYETKQIEYYKDLYDTYSENIKGEYGYIYLDSYHEYKKEYANRIKKGIELNQKLIDKRQSVDKVLKSNKNTVEQIVYTCHFRIRIPMGGLVRTEASITYYPNKKDEEKWGEVSLPEWDRKIRSLINL